MDINILVTALAIVFYVIGFISMAVRYGSEQERFRSKNKEQDIVIETIKTDLEKVVQSQKLEIERVALAQQKHEDHNAKQHEEFYASKNLVTELATDMKYIKSSLTKIESAIERMAK